MKINILLHLVFIFSILFAQSENNKSIEIETYDGNIFIGELIEENENSYLVMTKNGIEINIPKTSVKNIKFVETVERSGVVFRPDPNKSMYFFAPSAYPIESNNSYCRDFCLFFPSYNRGIGNSLSIQAGALLFPGAELNFIPMVLSAKYSLPKIGPARLATGMMYISIPFDNSFSDGDDNRVGLGITFATATIGNLFTHFSTSIGFGYATVDGEWEFSENPMVVLAGNSRMSKDLALVCELWKFPDVELGNTPLMIGGRFIGRKIAFDLGFIVPVNLEIEGVPFPFFNFTYHISD